MGYSEYVRAKGTVVSVGLPPDATVKADVFWTTIMQKKLVGRLARPCNSLTGNLHYYSSPSYVGTRQDAHEALAIAASGKVKTIYRTLAFSELPQVYTDMHQGKLAGRIVLDLWA